MKVALVSPRFAPDLGGVETHVRALATRLAARGHDVTVLTQADRRTVARLGTQDRVDGVRVRRFPLPVRALPDVPAPGLLAHLGTGLAGVDVVHAHSYHALPALGAALARGRSPFVLTPHYHGTGHTPVRARLHRVYRPLGGVLVRRARAVVAVSEAERRLIGASFGPDVLDRVTVIPNGVERPAVGEPLPVSGPTVLSVGRLEPYKRVDLLVRALVHLPDDVHLVVAGDGPARAPLSALVRSLALESRVQLTGRVDDPELARWRATAAVFATVSAHEAFGLGLAESLAAGLPVVASGIPAHREVARDAVGATLLQAPVLAAPGRSTTADDLVVGELARALRERIAGGRPVRRADHGVRSWEAVAAATEQLYALVSAPAGRGAR